MGISVGSAAVRAVLVQDRVIRWAGATDYEDLDDLVEAIGRLAAEGNGVARPRLVRVVLERPLVQLRTMLPAPPLSETAARRWVSVEAPRLFRKNGASLLTDARVLRLSNQSRVLLAGAVGEPHVRAILLGCAAAGLAVDAIGVAAEALPAAAAANGRGALLVRANGSGTESVDIEHGVAWRSRWPREVNPSAPTAWAPALRALGESATTLAAAYGAAIGTPGLVLLPAEVRAERERHATGRVVRCAAVGLALWVVAGAIALGRLVWTARSADRYLASVRVAVDSALAVRRELRTAEAAVEQVTRAERTRSRQVALLADLTAALPDSVYLVTLRITPDGLVRLSGYAPVAARALAALERVNRVREARFEGPIGREAVPGVGERDRFAIVARLERDP